jgi:hypothetical protein
MDGKPEDVCFSKGSGRPYERKTKNNMQRSVVKAMSDPVWGEEQCPVDVRNSLYVQGMSIGE